MTYRPRAEDVIDGRYRLRGRLGRGGMGEVWRAVDERLQRPVAIKLLGVEEPDLVARFEREARAQARIDHQHVAQIHDTGVEARAGTRVIYLVMELLPGPTLADRLEEWGLVAAEPAARLGDQIAAGLAAAHRAGIVHRDVKPANLMFDAHNRLKLLDFGIAWRVGDHRLTSPGQAIGTAAYMSPEQASGAEGDRAGDVYSLGCVLFEMLTGRWVFLGESRLELVVQRLNTEAPRVSSLVPVPSALDDLVAVMLRKQPGERPGLDDVRSVLGGVRRAPADRQAAAPRPRQEPAPSAATVAEPGHRRVGITRGRPFRTIGLIVAAAAVAIGALLYLQVRGVGTEATPTSGATVSMNTADQERVADPIQGIWEAAASLGAHPASAAPGFEAEVVFDICNRLNLEVARGSREGAEMEFDNLREYVGKWSPDAGGPRWRTLLRQVQILGQRLERSAASPSPSRS